MRRGYTNSTDRVGPRVVKTFSGPGAEDRCRAESRALTALASTIPVPRLIETGPTRIVTGFVDGRDGRDQFDLGRGDAVFRLCGQLLRDLHAVPPDRLGEGTGSAIVHGDFSPNNVLFDERAARVLALVDWEFCHRGAPVEDLAWFEWVVRVQWEDAGEGLRAFFDAYGSIPPWAERQAAMVERCRQLEEFRRGWDPEGDGLEWWSRYRREVETWPQLV